jgi:hypothetical protein
MALYGVERVLTEALAVLKAGMSAKLTALAAEYADSVTLPVPDSSTGYWCDVEPPDPDSSIDMGSISQPTICVWPLNVAPEGGPDLSNTYELAQPFVVGVIVRADTKAQSGKRQMRYVRAVVELLAAVDSLTCGQCLYTGTDWTQRELTPSEADYTLQGVLSGFVCTTFETP